MLGAHILKNTSSIIGVLIAVFIVQKMGAINTQYFCLSPYDSNIFRIFTAPLMHGSPGHLVGNLTALMVTLPVLFAVYNKSAWKVIVCGYVLPSIFVCIMGVSAFTLGISGLCYTVVWFLIFAGLKSKELVKFAIAMIAVAMYAGTLAGATPLAGAGISWEAHLGGLITALVLTLMKDK